MRLRQTTISIGITVIVLVGTLQARVDAVQTSWVRTQSATACGLVGYVTWLNFCRSTSVDNLNRTMTRDSDLRSKTGTISDDKFLDNYIVGTLIGASPNTDWISNGFTSTGPSVTFYGKVNCSGAVATLAPGDAFYPTASGLMSFAATGTSC